MFLVDVSKVANKAFFSRTVFSSLESFTKRFINVDLPAFVYPTIQIFGLGLLILLVRMFRRDSLIASSSFFFWKTALAICLLDSSICFSPLPLLCPLPDVTCE